MSDLTNLPPESLHLIKTLLTKAGFMTMLSLFTIWVGSIQDTRTRKGFSDAESYFKWGMMFALIAGGLLVATGITWVSALIP